MRKNLVNMQKHRSARYQITIFDQEDCSNSSYITSKRFDEPEELVEELARFEGFWVKVVDTATLQMLISGVFDDMVLNKSIYAA